MNFWQQLKDKFSNFYQGVIDTVTDPFKGLSIFGWGKKENPDRIKLDTIRQKHYDLIERESKKFKPDYNNLTKIITKDTKEYVSTIILEEQKRLGPPPCEFTVFTLGSLARQETGPVTDLEIGFLIKERNIENMKYFYQLSQNISDRIFLLGEHPSIGMKGMRMDEASNSFPHDTLLARNLTLEEKKKLLKQAITNRDWALMPFEGSRPFLSTPEEFAQFSQPSFTQDIGELNKLKKADLGKEVGKMISKLANNPALQKLGKTNLKRELDVIKEKMITRKGLESAVQDLMKKAKVKKEEGERWIAETEEMYDWIDKTYRPYNYRENNIANQAGKRLGRNNDYLCGSEKMFKDFITERNKYFSKKEQNRLTGKQNIAINCLNEDIVKRLSDRTGIFFTGKLGEKLDIKRELYRMGEQFITDLGFYYNCKKQNTIDIVNELMSRNLIRPDVANKLIDYMQFATGLRLKEQAKIKRQGFAAYFDQTEFNEDKADLEKEIADLKITINFMKKSQVDANEIAAKEREYVRLTSDLQHLIEMAPGKIYSAQDVALLKTKYAPLAKEIFEMSQRWALNKESLMPIVKQTAMIPAAPITKPERNIPKPRVWGRQRAILHAHKAAAFKEALLHERKAIPVHRLPHHRWMQQIARHHPFFRLRAKAW